MTYKQWLDQVNIELLEKRPDVSPNDVAPEFWEGLFQEGVLPSEAVRRQIVLRSSVDEHEHIKQVMSSDLQKRRLLRGAIIAGSAVAGLALGAGLFVAFSPPPPEEPVVMARVTNQTGPPQVSVETERRGDTGSEAASPPETIDETPASGGKGSEPIQEGQPLSSRSGADELPTRNVLPPQQPAAPTIDWFTAVDTDHGTNSMVSWRVRGADKVEILEDGLTVFLGKRFFGSIIVPRGRSFTIRASMRGQVAEADAASGPLHG